VSSCFLRLGPGARRPGAHAAYHAARLGVYVAVGTLAGTLGEALTQSGRFGLVQGVLQVGAGVVVILMGLDVLGLSPIPVTIGFAPAAWTQALFRRASAPAPLRAGDGESRPSRPAVPWKPALMAGVANGLMPCSLTLSIAVQAATTQSAAAGALLMASFGAGTLPSMVAVGVAFSGLSAAARGALLKGAAVVIILMGLLQIWQGLAYTRVMGKLVL
jgi:sulfite exporter TauE/SafE